MFRQWQSVHRIHIDAALMRTGRTLPAAVEDAPFQITHEALSSVARHAQASLVEGQQRLVLSVSDNGRGFDATLPPRIAHFGLMSMRERAQMLGGDVKIESEIGRGTTLQITLPLDALTPREREVFDLLAHGVSSPQIAKKLVVSEATVRTHITSVLDKLRLRDRTQVMVYALKRGIVRPQDLP
ncbi:MAG: LuxR C-terminal-related transcriptional regulator [Anaerolineae bacterium]|nr:LuxR C-terminal-related transcriptional regulator [Anaerolineae bacterium]NUQ05571.1 hypothetical protein [Anaerolineae bacterium]